MKSDVVVIDNQGGGFQSAVDETLKTAVFMGSNYKNTLHLQLITEEMLSLARSVTGEMKASFWIEAEGQAFDLHMSTETVLDREKREMLISSATSRKNEAAKGFLGKLRDAFEQAMVTDAGQMNEEMSGSIQSDAEWDGYERSVLKRLADDIKISIRGTMVDMTVRKDFSK